MMTEEARTIRPSSDKVMALNAELATITETSCATNQKNLDSPVAVHNLEVEGNHDYFVGPDAILCHNHRATIRIDRAGFAVVL